jgi:hypothetical protein
MDRSSMLFRHQLRGKSLAPRDGPSQLPAVLISFWDLLRQADSDEIAKIIYLRYLIVR